VEVGRWSGVAGAAEPPGPAADLPRILNITVRRWGFALDGAAAVFHGSSTPSEMGFLALHLTQYPQT